MSPVGGRGVPEGFCGASGEAARDAGEEGEGEDGEGVSMPDDDDDVGETARRRRRRRSIDIDDEGSRSGGTPGVALLAPAATRPAPGRWTSGRSERMMAGLMEGERESAKRAGGTEEQKTQKKR